MNTKAPQSFWQSHGKERVSWLRGIVFALAVTAFAELFLSHFLLAQERMTLIGRWSVAFLGLFTIYRFSVASLKTFRASPKDLLCLALILLGSILMIFVGNILSLGLSSYAESTKYARGVSPESFWFAIPYASGALLIQAVLGIHYGLVFTLCLATIVGLYVPGTALFTTLAVASSMVACLSIHRLRSRSVFVRAGINVCLVTLPFALASLLVSESTSSADVVVRVLAPLMSGILCTFIAAGVTPILEYLGGYVTDMRLLEMATLDHPLLKELSIQAPGTWNHSMVMGMMVESAADATGANPVLARVGAYFHDIGKTKKPLYFVENQIVGENRHDKLSPSMSALIIRAHVKDGIELARRHKLPRAIEDMIPQHHGTALMEYFFDKAQKEAEGEGADIEVDESLYRYPGPKPQTKEAGILMLADGIEAATRTISEPTPDRIQGLVQKMINKMFASGELSECDLTLQDLHIIAKCFTRVLSAIYHQRVAYAEPAEKVSERPSEKILQKSDEHQQEEAAAGGSDTPLIDPNGTAPQAKRAKSATDERPAKEPGKEDLKRLGM